MSVIKVIAEHIGLASSEPQKLAEWYENVFGLRKEQKSLSDRGPYFLTEPNTGFIIEIFFKEEIIKNNIVHFCFRVQNIEQAIAKLPADIEETAAP